MKKTTFRKREDQFLNHYLQCKMAVVVSTGEGRACRDGIAAVGDRIGFWQHQVVTVAPGLRKSHCWFMSYFSTASECPLNVGPEANFHFGVKWQSTYSWFQGPALLSFACKWSYKSPERGFRELKCDSGV